MNPAKEFRRTCEPYTGSFLSSAYEIELLRSEVYRGYPIRNRTVSLALLLLLNRIRSYLERGDGFPNYGSILLYCLVVVVKGVDTGFERLG